MDNPKTDTHPMKSLWNRSDRNFFPTTSSTTADVLPVGVYNIRPSKQGLFVELRPDGFTLPPKIYGIEESFIDRVARTFEKTGGNLGILLNGIRGTGKTVTAQLIAQKLGLPTLLVSQDMPGLIDFMDAIPHDVAFLCDEFEKVFMHSEKQVGGAHERGAQKLLPLMDGVMNGKHRKVFILTTNSLSVEPNLLQRPGRIRYLKTFGNLSRSVIEMLVDDQLERPAAKVELIDYIAGLELITIDIVTSVVEEMNIHGGSTEALDGIFNVKKLHPVYDVCPVDKDTMEEGRMKYSAEVSPDPADEKSVGKSFYVNFSHLGKIVSINGEYLTVGPEDEGLDETKEDHRLYRVVLRKSFNKDSFGKYSMAV